MDTNKNDMLNGAKTINYSGQMVGMIYTKAGKTFLISAQIISEFYSGSIAE